MIDARENLLDHFENPRNNGNLDCADCSGELNNPICGDRIHIDIKLSSDKTHIEDITFHGKGCIISQAAASMLTEHVNGKSTSEACALEGQTVLDLVGIPLTASRVKCALLSLQTLKQALQCAA